MIGVHAPDPSRIGVAANHPPKLRRPVLCQRRPEIQVLGLAAVPTR